jgi:hypothetical protein
MFSWDAAVAVAWSEIGRIVPNHLTRKSFSRYVGYLTDTALFAGYNEHERLPWRRLSARQHFSSLRSFGPTGRAGNTAMALEHSGQGRRNRLLAALTSADHSLLAPHLKELSLELGSLLQEAGEPVEQIYFPHQGMVSLLAGRVQGGSGVNDHDKNLSDKLDASGGVIKPPPDVDPEIVKPAPVPGPLSCSA